MIEVDVSELTELRKILDRIPATVEGVNARNRALLRASRILEQRLFQLTPVGPSRVQKKYDGILADAVRAKKTAYLKPMQSQVIVGFSKSKNKAGWRAHFTEYGFTHYKSGKFIQGQKFMERAERETALEVESRFEAELQKEIDKMFGE